MNLSPDNADAVRARITESYKRTRTQRIEAAVNEVAMLRREIKRSAISLETLCARLLLVEGTLNVLLQEFRDGSTVVGLPVVPE